MSLAVVIATNRPESFRRWLEAWAPILGGAPLYVVQDHPEKTDLNLVGGIQQAHQYSWKEIDFDLGYGSWIIPRRTSAIKSYGFLKAYQDGYDYVWTLDDDCFPEEDRDYTSDIERALSMSHPDDSWWNTLGYDRPDLYPRGYPYGIRQSHRPVMVHHGLWSGVPDLDGITALEHHRLRLNPCYVVDRVPAGAFFPMCGMNLAFRREMVPAMYFTLQGHMRFRGKEKALPFDRFDDIWAGLFAKKACDHLGYAVTSGAPSILHTKESDPTQRVIKEGPGIAAHELLWRLLADYQVPRGLNSVKGVYSSLAGAVDSVAASLPYPDYWRTLAEAMHLWTEFF